MKEQSKNRAKLGAFVLVATACLLLGLYFIGSKKNIFHSTITVSANFADVEGLLPGNNVRYNGINIGTVSRLYSIADSAVKVEFTVDVASTKFVNQSAIASIGTDGMLGSKLINITPGAAGAVPLQEGDVLNTLNPVKMDQALRTLTSSNDNLKLITDNLKDVSQKLNAKNSFLTLLNDTILSEHVKDAAEGLKITTVNTAIITEALSQIVQDVKDGKGSVGAILRDTVFSHQLNKTIGNMSSISDSLAIASTNFKNFSDKLKDKNGAMATILTDTAFARSLQVSLKNVQDASGNFNENMKALKYSWPFKKYYRRQKNATDK
jgi:phospholipid/cholesterol/gamma-HCH transport system substrate-binding protein